MPEIMSPSVLAACLAIVFIAAMMQVAIGMGFGMLASPLIALIAPEIVPGSVLVTGFAVAMIGTWRERRNIDLRELQLGIGGRIVGSGIAVACLLVLPDRSGFFVLFGVLVLVAVVVTALGIRFAFTHFNLGWLSLVSGVMGTITAVGAPPMALIYHDRPAEIVRPTLNAFFAAGAFLGIVGLMLSGWLGWADLLASALFVPAMLAGAWVARRTESLSASYLSPILLFLSGFAALMLIFRGLAGG